MWRPFIYLCAYFDSCVGGSISFSLLGCCMSAIFDGKSKTSKWEMHRGHVIYWSRLELDGTKTFSSRMIASAFCLIIRDGLERHVDVVSSCIACFVLLAVHFS